MKGKPLVTWFPLRFALLIALLVVAWPQRAQAVTLYWDINGATANVAASVTGSRGWDGYNTVWTSGANAATGTGVPQAGTTAADDLFFSSGTLYTTGTITASSALTHAASSINFEDPIVMTLSATLKIGGTGAKSGIFALPTATENSTVSGFQTLAAASTIQNAGTGVLAITAAITSNGTQDLTLQNHGATANGVTISGTALNHTGTVTNSGTGTGSTLVSAAIGGNVTNVIQNSATSQLILSGTNLYSGTTTATAGIVSFTTSLAMPGYAISPAAAFGTFASPKMSAASGATIAFPFGGATTGITNTDVTGLLNGSTYNIFAAGSSLGIDTTSAPAAGANLTTVITNAGANKLGFTKMGTNALTINAADTFTGPTAIVNGTLNAASLNKVVGGTASSSLGAPTTVLDGTISLGLSTTTGTLNYTGPGETTDRVFNLAGTTGGGGIINNGAGPLTISNPLTFATGAKTLSVGGSGHTLFSSPIVGTNSTGTTPLTINKSGTGTVTLTGANTATTLTIRGGTFDTGAGGLTLGNVGAGTVNTTGAAVGSTVFVKGLITLSGVGLSANGADIGAIAGVTLDMSNAVIAGSIADANMDFNPAGTLILGNSNTYTGQTQFVGTTVLATSLGTANGAAPSSLGQPAAGNSVSGNLFSTILLQTGTLRYVGTGETTDRALDLRAATTVTTLDQSGASGLLKFTAANTATGAGIKAMTLTGSTAGTGEIAGAIVNNSATNTTGITKTGTGTWTLSGANTYTGPTLVNAGNLILSQGGGTGVLDNTLITINSGGTLSPLAGASGFVVGNNLAAATGGRLTLNAGGTLNLADGAIGNLNLVQGVNFFENGAVFNGGTIIFDIGSTLGSNDRIDVRRNNVTGTGRATSSGSTGITLNPVTGTLSLTPGDYTLINAAGGLNIANFYLASPNLNVGGTLYNLSLSRISGTLVLTVATGGSGGATNLAYWNGTTNASWAHQPGGSGTATNWSASSSGTWDTFAVPTSVTNVLFTTNPATALANLSTTLDQAFTINSLAYPGLPNALGSTIASGTGGPNALTINAAARSGNPLGNGISVHAGSAAHTISTGVVLGANQTWTNSSTNPLTFTGRITGPGLTLTTAGTGAIQIGNGGTAGTIASDIALVSNGVLAFNRSDTVTQGADFASTISGTGGVSQNGSGTLVLSGTNTYAGVTTVANGTLNVTGTNNTTGNTNVANGTLNISGTGLIAGNTTTTRLALQPTVAGNSAIVNYSSTGTSTLFAVNGANRAGTASVLNHSAGIIQISPSYTIDSQSVVQATGAYGAYNISGGTLRTATGAANGSSFTVTNEGTASATNGTIEGVRVGIVNVSGTGVIDHTNAARWVSNSLSQVTVTDNGKIDYTGSAFPFYLVMSTTVVGGSYGVLNIAGPGAQVITGPRPLGFGDSTALGQGDGLSAFVNLAAGTLSTGAAGYPLLPAAPTAPNYIYYNYAGGTLRASGPLPGGWSPSSGAWATVINTIFGAINNSAVAGAPSFAGGLTVDTNGNAVSIPAQVPLIAATGVGVTQTNLSVAGGSGYIGAPSVTFSKPAAADGVAAAGYALISGGAVTGIVITSPGVYASGETPTINLLGGFATGAGTPATVTVSPLTTANTTGDLTKMGAGTLTINGPSNLNGGNVTVTGGVLNAGFTPAGIGAIKVSSLATLNLHDGAVTTMAVNGLTLASGSSLGFDLGVPGVNDILNLTGTRSIAPGVSLNFNNLGGLAPGTYDLLNVSEGTLNAADYTIGIVPRGGIYGFNYHLNYHLSTTNANQTLRLTTSALNFVYWRGDAGPSWSTPGPDTSWSTGSSLRDLGAPPAPNATLVFITDNAVGPAIVTTLDGNFTADSLRFLNSLPGVSTVEIAQGTSGILTLNPASSNNGIFVDVTTRIYAPVTTGAAQTWEVGINGGLRVGGNLTISHPITKSGRGHLTLTGTNSGAGGLTVAEGWLIIRSPTALGTGTFTIGAGSTITGGAEVISNAGNNAQNWNGNFAIGDNLDLGTGAVSLGTNVQLTTLSNGTSLTVGGIIGDGGNNRGLTKAGQGTVILTGANTYSGNTTVSTGVLTLTNAPDPLNANPGNDASTITIAASGATLSLTYPGTDKVDKFFIGSSPRPAGVYGHTNSGATNGGLGVGAMDAYFGPGTGTLTVANGNTYASWIKGFFFGITNPSIIGAGADPDRDGIPNGIEIVIGGNPALGMDAALLPTIEWVTNPVSLPAIPAGDYLLFTYRRTDLSVFSGTAADCELAPDLLAPWTAATGAPGVVIQVDDDFTFTPPADATDRVRVYVPGSLNPTIFGRLKVTVP